MNALADLGLRCPHLFTRRFPFFQHALNAKSQRVTPRKAALEASINTSEEL